MENNAQISLMETVRRVRKFNKWRRGDDARTFDELKMTPKKIGKDLDTLCDVIEHMQNSVVEVMVFFPNVEQYIRQLENMLDAAHRRTNEIPIDNTEVIKLSGVE